MINMEADAAETRAPSDDKLNAVSNLIEAQVTAENLVSEIDSDLKEAKEHLRLIREERLPEAMRIAGVIDFTTTDFYSVSLKDVYYANIKPDNQIDAFAWLKEEGHDDIIKNDVNLSFGRGEEQLAIDAVDRLVAAGYTPSTKKHIHWQTLRAFVKEQMIKGVNLPDSIDVHVVPTTKVKRK